MEKALPVIAHEKTSVSGFFHVLLEGYTFLPQQVKLLMVKNYCFPCLNTSNFGVLLKINFPHFINICLQSNKTY